MAGDDKSVKLQPRVEIPLSPIAHACHFKLKKHEKLRALPGFHAINDSIEHLKLGVQNGERGFSSAKCGCYLAYRVITYLGLPLVSNLLSTILSLVLTLITLPTKCCTNKLNRKCWIRLQGSFAYTMQSLYDLTADIRHLTGCCCPPDSAYRFV